MFRTVVGARRGRSITPDPRSTRGGRRDARSWLRVAGLAAAAVAFAAVSSACGSSSGGDAASSTPTLKVVVGSPTVANGLYYVAKQEGLFQKYRVNVEQVPGGATQGSSLLLSGRADVWVGTTVVTIPLTLGGKPVSVVFNDGDFGPATAALVGKSGMTLDQLKAAGSNCQITVTPPGTLLYGWLLDVEKANGLRCMNAPVGSLGALTAGVVSGASDAAVVLPEQAFALKTAHQADVVLDPVSMSPGQLAKDISIKPFPSGAMLGLRSDLDNNRTAVTRFVQALREAAQFVHKSTPEQLTDIIKKDPDFAENPTGSLTVAWKSAQKSMPYGPSAGEVTESEWTTGLDSMQDWGLITYSPDDPKLSYSQVVDMSFLDGK
jgi:ABC-type nitrate/sulfonate/bicarbonate transport system substrate-binding protein